MWRFQSTPLQERKKKSFFTYYTVDLPRNYIPPVMPGEVIDRPNPQPLPSHLPDDLEKLKVTISHETLDQEACDSLLKFRRAASYIAAGMKGLHQVL